MLSGGYLLAGLNVEGHQGTSLNVLYVPWGLRDGQVGQRIVLRDTMGTSLDVPYVLCGLRDGMDRWDSTMECPILYVPWGLRDGMDWWDSTMGCPSHMSLAIEGWDGHRVTLKETMGHPLMSHSSVRDQ